MKGITEETDVDRLVEVGRDLADEGRLLDAARRFRRAADLGDADAIFNLANTVRDLARLPDAVNLYREAVGRGVVEASAKTWSSTAPCLSAATYALSSTIAMSAAVTTPAPSTGKPSVTTGIVPSRSNAR